MKKINEITDGSILLVPSTATALMRKKLLTMNKQRIKIISLEQYLDDSLNEHLSDIAFKMKIHQEMKILANSCTQFRELCATPSFEDEVLHFLNELHSYEIQLDDLPTDSPTQRELKMILSHLYNEDTLPKRMIEALASCTQQNIIICYRSYSLFEKLCFDKLIELGAEMLEFDQFESEYEFYHATNQRQEVEAMAQMIATHHVESHKLQIATCDASYLPLIAQVFDRYEIPFEMISAPLSNDVMIKAMSLIQMILNPSIENTIQCLNCGCFSKNPPVFYLQALQLFQINVDQPFLDLCNVNISEDILSARDVQKVMELIERANQERLLIDESIQRLLQSENFQEIFEIMDEILREFAFPNEDTINAIRTLQTAFRDVLPFMKEKQDLKRLLQCIEDMSNNSSMNSLNKVSVGTLNQLLFHEDHLFIVGATQKNFPGFSGAVGVFDEHYLKNCLHFPSLDVRYNHHVEQQLSLMTSAKHVVVSYPLINYEGKVNEASLEIENILAASHVGKSKTYPLTQKQKKNMHISNISEQTANTLFVHEQKIKGSISRLEKYIGCPYSYFLKYGLRISEPIDPNLNDQMIGQLSHYLLEELVKRHNKDYASASYEEVFDLIHEKLSEVNQIYPHLNFNCIEQKQIVSIMNNLKQLKEIEQHSSLIPTLTEYEFNHEIKIHPTLTLSLKGIIDRIDEGYSSFRIIDYKSSIKKLDVEKVFNGTQLQLVTYAMIAMEELKKQPLGAFYYSFKNENLSLAYGKMKRTKPIECIEIDKDSIEKEQSRATRFNGWVMSEDISNMDDEGSTIVGVKASSKGVKASKVYDPRVLKVKIEEILHSIVTQILSGNIQCRPNEQACLFCEYHAICRFSGSPRKNELLISIPKTLILGGSDDE